MAHGQGEQVGVRDLAVAVQAAEVRERLIEHGNVVGPELVVERFGQRPEALCDLLRGGAVRGQVELSGDGGALTADGAAFLRDVSMNIDIARSRAINHGTSRIFCRPCLDWSERRPHIAGAIGAALCEFSPSAGSGVPLGLAS